MKILCVMKKMIKVVFCVMSAMLLCVSCNINDNDYDEPQWSSYVTVATAGNSFYFVDDSGEKIYPGDVSRIGAYDTDGKDGKRAYIFFNYLRDNVDGFSSNIALYKVIDVLSKDVEVAKTGEDIKEAGDDPLTIDQMKIRGEWLDINFSLFTERYARHKMTLMDNSMAEPPANMPSGYQYLELRQNAGDANKYYMGSGNVSYKLNGYHPSVTGKKGLYIRVNTISSGIGYYIIDYVTPAPLSKQKNNLYKQNVAIE